MASVNETPDSVENANVTPDSVKNDNDLLTIIRKKKKLQVEKMVLVLTSSDVKRID